MKLLIDKNKRKKLGSREGKLYVPFTMIEGEDLEMSANTTQIELNSKGKMKVMSDKEVICRIMQS